VATSAIANTGSERASAHGRGLWPRAAAAAQSAALHPQAEASLRDEDGGFVGTWVAV
jgi:hypothetical protein